MDREYDKLQFFPGTSVRLTEVPQNAFWTRILNPLLISCIFNITLVSFLIYLWVRDTPPSRDFGFFPKTVTINADDLDYKGLIATLMALREAPLEQLRFVLTDPTPVEFGYKMQDLALACLVSDYGFDLYRALGSSVPIKQMTISLPLNEVQENTSITIYPNLTEKQFTEINAFAKKYAWPFQPYHLFKMLKSAEYSSISSLQETFFFTQEFQLVEMLLNRAGIQDKHLILGMLLKGEWSDITEFLEEQKKCQDFSDKARVDFLVKYMKKGSEQAVAILTRTNFGYLVRSIDDATVSAVLSQLIEYQYNELASKYAMEILASPRSNDIRMQAAEVLFLLNKEQIPIHLDLALALKRFGIQQPDYIVSMDTNTIENVQPVSKKVVLAKQESTSERQNQKRPAVVAKQTQDKPKVVNSTVQPRQASVSKSSSLQHQKAKTTQTVTNSKSTPRNIPTPKLRERSYVVKEGDNLWRIARRYKVEIEQIKRINHLKSDALQPGLVLRIPPSVDDTSF